MRELIGKQIYIWGTGNKAESFWKRYKLVAMHEDTPYHKLWQENILGFIDSNQERQKTPFHGKPVVSLQTAVSEGMEVCIIAVVKHDVIRQCLDECCSCEIQSIYVDDFWEKCRDDALGHSANYLREKKIVLPENFWEAVHSVQCIRAADDVGTFLDCLLFYELFKRGHQQNLGDLWFDGLKKVYGLSGFVSKMEWIYGDNIEPLLLWHESRNLPVHTVGAIVTIGIYAGRFYGGGIEKVLSLLIPLYIEKKYRVVLITDTCESVKEYSLPKEAERYMLQSSYDGELESRLHEFAYCIETYHIDVLCFHFGYERISAFYEMLFARLLGISVVMEIHSAHKALLEEHKGSADKLGFVYRVASRIVTLSDADRAYWEGRGCRCVIIPNPIDNFGLRSRSLRDTGKGGRIILWVGRIVERPKRVTDAARIMKEIANHMKDARLLIVGSRDDAGVYEKLCRMVRELGIEQQVQILDYRSDMRQLYIQADVVLMTSESESYSNVLMESRMFARPVVMYDIPWLSTIKGGKGMIAVPQGNIRSAARAVMELLEDAKKWEKYSIDAWNVMQDFAAYDVAGAWEKLFREVLQTPEKQ